MSRNLPVLYRKGNIQRNNRDDCGSRRDTNDTIRHCVFSYLWVQLTTGKKQQKLKGNLINTYV